MTDTPITETEPEITRWCGIPIDEMTVEQLRKALRLAAKLQIEQFKNAERQAEWRRQITERRRALF